MSKLSQSDRAELDALNRSVEDAIAKRREWLDAKVAEIARLKPGDEIFNLDTGERLGVVSAIKRIWRDRDEGVRDNSIDHYCEFETHPRCFDNTARQPLLRYGTRSDAIDDLEARRQRLRRHLG
jgi:hypothetical protein